MLAIDPLQSESACLLAIENLRKKKICLNAAIAELEKKLRHIRFYRQEISTEEFRHLQALPLSSGIRPAGKLRIRKLPIRPSHNPIVA
jgi:hypothetical protein